MFLIVTGEADVVRSASEGEGLRGTNGNTVE